MARVVRDPYEDVDWDSYGQYKGQFHVHPHYGDIGPPQDIIDRYEELDYDVLCIQVKDNLDRGMTWPWTELSSLDSDWEDRDPEDVQMIAVPGAEVVNGEHLGSFFSTLTADDYSGRQNQYQTMGSIVNAEPETEGAPPLGYIEHPGRYTSDWGSNDDCWVDDEPGLSEWGEQNWRQYLTMYRDYENCFGIAAVTYSFNYDDRAAWDDLLTYFEPDRTIIGASNDDISDLETADRGWVTFQLADDEFDPSDQASSRVAVNEAWREGRTTFSVVDDPQDDAPVIHSIEHDREDRTVSIDASDYDTIEWISCGEIVGTGETFHYGDESCHRYFRAELKTPNPSLTATQAWAIVNETRRTTDGKLRVGGEFVEDEATDGYRRHRDGDVSVPGEVVEGGDDTRQTPNGDLETNELEET